MNNQSLPHAAEAALPPATCSARAFRAGDHVFHKPSGETWSLAYDEHRGQVSACGWPESIAEAKDCELVKAATDEERMEMLQTWANQQERDHRASMARHQLATEPNAHLSNAPKNGEQT